MPLASTARLRSSLRRHRRALAALLAGTAMACALLALRPGEATAPAPAVSPPGATRAGELTVPVEVASPTVAATVSPGDLVDVVALVPGSTARVLAERARVVDHGGAPMGDAIVLVAVPAADALPLVAAAAATPIALLIHPPTASSS